MTKPRQRASLAIAVLVAAMPLLSPRRSFAQDGGVDATDSQLIPNTGQLITPKAPAGARFEPLNPGLANYPEYLAGQAVTDVRSPDGKTLLILTSGYNREKFPDGANQGSTDPAASNEYVFVYDISSRVPIKKQVIQVPNTYSGITFDNTGKTFFVSGGVDDNVHIYIQDGGQWKERPGSPVSLNHSAGAGLAVRPEAAGIAIGKAGRRLVVANYYNDSISVLELKADAWVKTHELDLRPGKNDSAQAGVPGGEYPYWVVMKGDDTAYISSMRDREIVVVDLSEAPRVAKRIKVVGQPNKMTLNH